MRELHIHKGRDPLTIGLLVGVLLLMVLVLLGVVSVWQEQRSQGNEDDRIWRELRAIDERAPCDGCFDSLKWRVDIHHPVRPGDPYERIYGSRNPEGTGGEEEAVRPPGGTERPER